jgi:serine/threonine-protein kinase
VRPFGNYVLIDELEASRSSSVHLAQRLGAEELCVVKILHEAGSTILESRFRREAEVASLLAHENIARLIDAGREDGSYFIATELVRGVDLRAIVSMGAPISVPMAVRIALDVLAALHYAHEMRDGSGKPLGIVHRDVSPKNVMVGFGGEVKVIDFGVARGEIGQFRTAPGMLLGTFRYMSPEQTRAEPIDRRSDVYSAAVLLHELLAKRPLIGDEDPRTIVERIAFEAPPRLTGLANVPPALDDAVRTALAKAPGQRFPSADDFAHAIRAAATEVASHAEIGELIAATFPETKARLESLVRRAEAGTLTDEPTTVRDHAAFEPTRAAPAPIALPPAPRASMRPWVYAGVTALLALGLAVAAIHSQPHETVAAPRASGLAEPSPELSSTVRIEAKASDESAPIVVARSSAEDDEPSIEIAAVPPPIEVSRAAPRRSHDVATVPPGERPALAADPAPNKLEAARPPPAKPRRDPAIDRLARRLHDLEMGRAEPAALLELAAGIKTEAERIADPAVRNHVRRKAHASGAVGDLRGLAEALAELESAISPRRTP